MRTLPGTVEVGAAPPTAAIGVCPDCPILGTSSFMQLSSVDHHHCYRCTLVSSISFKWKRKKIKTTINCFLFSLVKMGNKKGDA